MRIALAQIDPIIGDIPGNTAKALDYLAAARAQRAQLVVFPEMSIIGYPPKDLLLKPAVLARCRAAVERVAAACTDIAAIVGYPCPSDQPVGRPLYNAAAVCAHGRIVHRHVKSLLPTYDVFDESRYFEPGPKVDLTEIDRVKLGISVCEDLWNDAELFSRRLYHDNPIAELAGLGAQLFINCSASPFVVRKHAFRLKLLSHAAKAHGLPLVYVNQVGGNDELIFDGNSCVFDGQGQLLAHAKDFQQDLLVVDVPTPLRHPVSGKGTDSQLPGTNRATSPSRIETPRQGMASVYAALVLGLRDYCLKCGFESAVLGLSGGIDSAVCACLAVEALGKQNVTGVSMPSRFSSEGSRSDAQLLADNLGIAFHTVPIADPHQALESLLTPHFAAKAPDATEENIQARLRGVILMAFSNKFGSLLVTTGNKSEMAVGYCTLYGDMNGGLALIGDVPKTMVYELSRWINTPDCPLYAACGKPPIPEDSITKPPSAELRANQTDQDSLPPYDVLDQLIDRYVEREQSAEQIIGETGFDPAMVNKFIRLIDLNEYKRKQAAPVLKITGRAFGFGRRMPIAQRYDPRV